VAKAAVRKKGGAGRFAGIIVGVAVIGIATIGYLVARPRPGIRPVDPNLPAGTAEGYLIGNPDAPVQVIEFADFECPACGQWTMIHEPDVRQRLISTGQISFRFYDFPLDNHPNSWPASNAAACAADQGKFVEMHDAILHGQDKWSGYATRNPKPPLEDMAKSLGLDMAAWNDCFDTQKHYGRIKANLQEGVRRGVGQTPTFIIGSKLIPGGIPYDEFKRYVDEAAAEAAARAKAAPAPATKKTA